jgi:hypothetical protein
MTAKLGRRSAARGSALGVLLAFATSACSGQISAGGTEAQSAKAAHGSSGNGGSPSSGGGGPGQVAPGTNPGDAPSTCAATQVPGVTPLLKLSTVQYKNTVRDLLTASGAGSMLSSIQSRLDSVPDDSLGDSFRGLDDRISLEHVQAYFDVGVAVGDALRDQPAMLSAVAGSCASQTPLASSCAHAFIERFGQLAYRRPLSSDEIAELEALNDGQRTPAEAVRAIVIVLMSSPRFVNHVEIDGGAVGAQDDVLQLTSYEIASRLSYLFWQTMPDAQLFAAAADGSLATQAGFAQQLDRVFHDDRSRNTLWQFWNEWLRLETFTGFEITRPGFQSLAAGEPVGQPGHDYYADMVQEMRDLTQSFTFDRTATLADLLTTDVSTTRSADLARLYGVEPWSGSGDYPTLQGGTRAGLFQRAALLVSNLETTNPFHRGAMVRKNLLCDPLSRPDPNTLPPGSLDPPPVTAAQTTRQRYQAKVEGNATCAACHNQFSAIGFVLESFDALGRYRTLERVFDEETGKRLADLPIDTSAVTRIALDDERPVANAMELNQRVVDSRKVETCLATKYFDFAERREATPGSMDACLIDELAQLLQQADGGLAGAFERIARDASFFVRKVGPQ